MTFIQELGLPDTSRPMQYYLLMEKILKDLREDPSDAEEVLLYLMDIVWLDLTDEEQEYLNNR